MLVNHLIRECAMSTNESPRYAFIAPYLKQAKDIAWDYVHKYAAPIPMARFNESELRLDLPGDRRLRLYGADNPDSIQGIYLDGVVMDEYQLTTPRLFGQIVRPMLADRKGWVIFAGKPLGRNHFYTLHQKMANDSTRLVRMYRASETGILDAQELRDMRVGPPPMSDDEYAQELECSWEAAIQGAYYARQMEAVRADHRIRPVPWEPNLVVDTWWDLGVDDSTAIIFTQTCGREVHIVDYLEDNGKDLAFYVGQLQRRGYIYGAVHLPHDAKGRELGSGKSIEDQLRDLMRPLHLAERITVHPRPKDLKGVNSGIESARRLFARCWFDEAKTGHLVECLTNYRRLWDEKRGDFHVEPYHDWTSHGADAFRLLGEHHRIGTLPVGPFRATSAATNVFDYNRTRPGVRQPFRAGTMLS